MTTRTLLTIMTAGAIVVFYAGRVSVNREEKIQHLERRLELIEAASDTWRSNYFMIRECFEALDKDRFRSRSNYVFKTDMKQHGRDSMDTNAVSRFELYKNYFHTDR